MSKKQSLLDFKKDIHKKECWTVEEFAVITGYAPDFIRKQLEMGEIKSFLPIGSTNPKITRQAFNKWVERRSYAKNNLCDNINNRRRNAVI